MKVTLFETTRDGAVPLGEFILSDDGNDIDLMVSDEMLPNFERTLEETPQGMDVEDDPAGWLIAMAEEYSRGSMIFSVLDYEHDDEDGGDTQDAMDVEAWRSEAAKKAWQKRQRAKPRVQPESQHADPDPDKVKRAVKSYNAMNVSKLKIAHAMEIKVSDAIDGNRLGDNKPFDVMWPKDTDKPTHAFEVKTIVAGKRDKITMHKDSLARKVDEADKEHLKAHTVAIDYREKPPKVYYRDGLGSFRLDHMDVIDFKDLRKVLAS